MRKLIVAVVVVMLFAGAVFAGEITKDDLESKKQGYYIKMASNHQDIRNAEKGNDVLVGAIAGIDDLLMLLQNKEAKEIERAEFDRLAELAEEAAKAEPVEDEVEGEPSE